MIRIVMLLGISTFAFCWDGPVREVTSEAEKRGDEPIHAFYSGYVYWSGVGGPVRHDGSVDNRVFLYEPNGRLAVVFETRFAAPRGVAVDGAGTIAAARGGRWNLSANAIEFRDKSGELVKIITTGDYVPTHVAFGADQALWVFGTQYDSNARSDAQGLTVRKYLRDGTLAGTYLPRSLFPPGRDPAESGWQRSSIHVAKDRVGLWAVSGRSGNESEWVEMDLDGKVLGRWPLDQFGSQFKVAMTSDGYVYVSTFDDKEHKRRTFTLNRPSSAWETVKDAPSGYLEGADGNALVFSDDTHGPLHLRWYEHP